MTGTLSLLGTAIAALFLFYHCVRVGYKALLKTDDARLAEHRSLAIPGRCFTVPDRDAPDPYIAAMFVAAYSGTPFDAVWPKSVLLGIGDECHILRSEIDKGTTVRATPGLDGRNTLPKFVPLIPAFAHIPVRTLLHWTRMMLAIMCLAYLSSVLFAMLTGKIDKRESPAPAAAPAAPPPIAGIPVVSHSRSKIIRDYPPNEDTKPNDDGSGINGGV